MNYFDLFGLSKRFIVDNKKLSKKLHQLQKKYHPDLCRSLSINVQKHFLEKSTYINKAYSILKDPLKRGKYLLFLHGIEINNKDFFSCNDELFLKKQFELNLKLESFSKSKDNLQDCIIFLKNLCNTEDNIFKKMQNCFLKNSWLAAKDFLIKLMFIKKIRMKAEEIREFLSEMS